MPEPLFLSRSAVEALHQESLRLFGGTSGIRDEGLIESALASALNVYHYTDGDFYHLAAAYAYHIAESQAYLDGNKRTAVAAALTFLALNGCGFIQDDGRLYHAMIAIAEKRLDKEGLAQVLRTLFQVG